MIEPKVIASEEVICTPVGRMLEDPMVFCPVRIDRIVEVEVFFVLICIDE